MKLLTIAIGLFLGLCGLVVCMFVWSSSRTHGQRLSVMDNTGNNRPLLQHYDKRTKLDVPVNNMTLYPCLEGSVYEDSMQYTSCVHFFKEPFSFMENSCGREETYKTPYGETPICIYDPEVDIFVSAHMVSNRGGWEAGLVLATVDLFRTNPSLIYLDLGCNIGVYTIPVAKMGRKVVAIDPLLENLRMLNQSLSKGNIGNDVTFVWNAVSDKRQYVTLNKDKEANIGGTAVKMYNGTSMGDYAYVAEAVTLDDLLPLFAANDEIFMKLDIEGNELRAFRGAKRFFENVNVRYIQLEMLFHKESDTAEEIIRFLKDKGMRPYKDLHKRTSLDEIRNFKEWPTDVYFIKG